MLVTGEPLFTVTCNEPEGEVERGVFLLELTRKNLQRFWDAAKQFPTLYGRQLNSVEEFVDLFLSYDESGNIHANGLFFYVPDENDNFLGVFYITNAIYDNNRLIDANVHYSFFDKRHRGRVPLVKRMLKFTFEEFGFQRLSVSIPLYATKFTRHFISNIGFTVEGKKRKAAFYQNQWWDELCYGILKEEVLKEAISTNTNSEVTEDDGEDENGGRRES